MSPYKRWPLGPISALSEVQARVAIRLVQLDYRKNPGRYAVHYTGVHELAEQLRADEHNPYTGYFYLVSLSKALLAGMTMDQWRHWAAHQPWDVLRAVHKRPFKPAGKR